MYISLPPLLYYALQCYDVSSWSYWYWLGTGLRIILQTWERIQFLEAFFLRGRLLYFDVVILRKKSEMLVATPGPIFTWHGSRTRQPRPVAWSSEVKYWWQGSTGGVHCPDRGLWQEIPSPDKRYIVLTRGSYYIVLTRDIESWQDVHSPGKR